MYLRTCWAEPQLSRIRHVCKHGAPVVVPPPAACFIAAYPALLIICDIVFIVITTSLAQIFLTTTKGQS